MGTPHRRQYDITASIVVYNPDMDKLYHTINSFFKTPHLKLRLLIVDNSPHTSKSLAEHLEEIENIDYIKSGTNLGFGRGHNLAIQKSKDLSNYHLVLNPDISFGNKVLGYLHGQMESRKKIGLSSTKILFPDGNDQFVHKRLPSPIDVITRIVASKIPALGWAIKSLYTNKMNGYEMRNMISEEEYLCPSISGCFMLFRRSTLDKISGFDQRFFLYFEDIDISRRSYEISENVVFNNIHVLHHWERGSYKNLKLLVHQINSAIKYFNKWGWIFDKKRELANSSIPKPRQSAYI